MDEKIDQILSNYDFKVQQIIRVRGALCLTTNQGIRLLKVNEASMQRVEFEHKVTQYLYTNGFQNVDCIVQNKEGLLTTSDATGESYLVKRWFLGEECKVREKEDLVKAVANLGRLHMVLNRQPDWEGVCGWKEENCSIQLERHNQEMKRIYTYIRGKKRKTEFERCILRTFDIFYQKAEEGLFMVKDAAIWGADGVEKKIRQLRHGNYTYHNVLFTNREIATLNFERAGCGLQLFDFYYFLRKVMEKNSWKPSLGERLLREYTNYCVLDTCELNMIAFLLYYPEKYWKILNHYYNSKKTWTSDKDMEKLELVCEQERQKLAFLEEIFSLSI
ncbi:MAG: hypothetical protein PWP24_560 [Clostridiales bacterium]|nr:hypothetical protein [Clostridiales bacterium]